MNKLKFLIVFAFAVFGGFAVASPVYAANGVFEEACSNSNSVICNQQKNGESKTLGFVKNIISLLLVVIGIISVIVIIVGGIRFTTSNGNADQVKSAKNTILYAIVGLVVAIVAFPIVTFVLERFN